MIVNAAMEMEESNPCSLISDATQLTVLPAAVPELLSSLSDEDISFHELATTIGKFPSIAARLIFLANSAWAAPVTEITTLEMACAKLGLTLVKSVSISLAIAAPFDPAKCPAFKSERFWATALLVADAASWLAPHAREFEGGDTGTVHTAALLHNLGLLWMADQIPETLYNALEAANSEPGRALDKLLREDCGADHAEVGGCLARAWELPSVIESAMKNHLNFSYSGEHWQVAQLTGYSVTMMHCLEHEIDPLPGDLRLERLGIHAEQRDAVFERMQQRHEQVNEMVRDLFC